MARCLQLAENGLGMTYPNPLVGCVIVHKGNIIGEGWHRKAGEPHAEVIAIESVEDKSLLKDSELYVNLEPCSHHGKTPPCADLIVEHEIPRVFIGSGDDNELVRGQGIKRLEAHGIEVRTGILEESCRWLNRRFYTFHQKKRPYIILKWAESSNGFIFPSHKEAKSGPVWISNTFSRQLVHKWRAEEESILVGTRTVLQDDPSLTVRDFKGERILRLVIDRNGKLNSEKKVFDGDYDTVVFSTADQKNKNMGQWQGKNIQVAGLDFDKSVALQIVKYLWRTGLQSVIVEGGAATLEGFIADQLWDEARVFIGSPVFEGGLRAPDLGDYMRKERRIGDDRLVLIKNESAPEPGQAKA